MPWMKGSRSFYTAHLEHRLCTFADGGTVQMGKKVGGIFLKHSSVELLESQRMEWPDAKISNSS